MDFVGEELGGRVSATELCHLVEIAVVEFAEHSLQDIERAADVANDAVGVERFPAQLGLDHVGRTVQLLCRPEDSTDQAVRDHEVMAHRDAVHGCPPFVQS